MNSQITNIRDPAGRLELGMESPFRLSARRSAEQGWETDHLGRLQAAAKHRDDAVFITDQEGCIIWVNPMFETLTGFAFDEAIGKTASLFMSGVQAREFYAKLWLLFLEGKEYCGVFVGRKKNDSVFHMEQRIRPFTDSNGNVSCFVSTCRDVTEDVCAMERLSYLANHDMLTGLANRMLFKDRLNRELVHAARHGGGFAVFFLDVDQLKRVNDLHGHHAGDQILQTMAGILQNCVRMEDTVARLGGDEFAMILKEVSQRESALKIVATIMASLRQGATIEGIHTPMSVSIGICLYPGDGCDEHTLLERADRAMYRAKSAGGGGYYFFDPDMEDQGNASTDEYGQAG